MHHGLGSTSTMPPMRPMPPTMMQNQQYPYPMPFQPPSHDCIPQHHVNPPFNYYQYAIPYYCFPPFHSGMNQPQNIMLPDGSPYPPVLTQRSMTPPGLPPVADHTVRFTSSEPGQYCHPATAPPICMDSV